MDFTKTLIIYDSIITDFVPYFKSYGIKTYKTFKDDTLIQKITRKLAINYGVAVNYSYDDWKYEVKNVDTILIFASKRTDYVKSLAEKYPLKRIIIWYWNPVSRCFNPKDLKYDNVEFWSFDKADCKKYGLKYNSTFYFKNIKVKEIDINKVYDIIFLGLDKGRKKLLDELEVEINKQNIKTYFHIHPGVGVSNPEKIKMLPYLEYLHLVTKSKAIFDFLQVNQMGLTLRSMESVFFKKKLITNDENIVHEKFYNKNNIFILGKDDFNKLSTFITSPYQDLDVNILAYYDFENWIKRFDNE